MAPTKFAFLFWVSTLTFFLILKIDLSDQAKATEHMYLDHLICKNSPEYTQNCSCKLNFITRMIKSYTSYCQIIKQMDKVITHTQLFYKFRSGFKPFLVDIYLNLCDYLENKAASKLMNIVMPKIRQSLTTSKRFACPIVGQFDIVNMTTDGGFVNNMFVPVGDYFVNVTAMNNNDFVWNGQFYATIPAGKTIEDDKMGR